MKRFTIFFAGILLSSVGFAQSNITVPLENQTSISDDPGIPTENFSPLKNSPMVNINAGDTELCLYLKQKYECAIISVDSSKTKLVTYVTSEVKTAVEDYYKVSLGNSINVVDTAGWLQQPDSSQSHLAQIKKIVSL